MIEFLAIAVGLASPSLAILVRPRRQPKPRVRQAPGRELPPTPLEGLIDRVRKEVRS